MISPIKDLEYPRRSYYRSRREKRWNCVRRLAPLRAAFLCIGHNWIFRGWRHRNHCELKNGATLLAASRQQKIIDTQHDYQGYYHGLDLTAEQAHQNPDRHRYRSPNTSPIAG